MNSTLRREFEKTEAGFTAVFIGHHEDNPALRDQAAFSRNGIAVPHLAFRGQSDAFELFVLEE